MSISVKCPYCGKTALVGSCGNFWCPSCKRGHWYRSFINFFFPRIVKNTNNKRNTIYKRNKNIKI